MFERETYIPLLIGLLLAAMLHLAAAPLLRFSLSPSVTAPKPPREQLVVQRIVAPEAVVAGKSFAVQWQVANEGDAPAQGPWADRLYLSSDRVLSEDDVLITTVPRTASLAVGETYEQRVDGVKTPGTSIGLNYVIVVVEGPEPDDARQQTNTAPASAQPAAVGRQAFWIETGEPVELAVTSLQAPEQALAGGATAFTFEVTNDSEGVAWRSWTDMIVLSEDDELSADDLVLGQFERPRALLPEEHYTQRTRPLPLPRDLVGTYHILVVADFNNAVCQTPVDESSKRVARRTIELLRLDLPDLAVVDINVPQTVVRGESTAMSYSVANLGLVAPSEPWLDGIFLSSDDQLSEDDQPVTTTPAVRLLEPGTRYVEDQVVFTVPKDMPLPVYLLVKADVDDTVDEGPFKENNTMAVELNVVETKQNVIGKIKPPFKQTVAWISYDDFKKLQAPRDEFLQPAVQELADPVKNAPYTLDPTPPATRASQVQPSDQDQPEEQRPTQSNVDAAQPGDAAPTTQPTERRDPLARARRSPQTVVDLEAGPGATDEPAPRDVPTPGPVDSPIAGTAPIPPENPSPQPTDTEGDNLKPSPTASKTPAEKPAETDGDTQPRDPQPGKSEAVLASKQQETQPSKAQQGDTPTAAPRQDRESPPVTRMIDTLTIKPGGVVTGEGLEIKTFAPRPSTITLYSTIPNNPKATLVFDKTGTVIDVRLQRSTGSPNWDGPVITSLYRWKAQGKMIDELEHTLEVPVQLILSPE